MKKRVTPANKAAKKTAATGGFVIGHARFSKISAVEGIVLVPNMKARKSRLDRTGATAAERRAAIIKAYKR
jgi:hypothetical protein